MPGRERPLNVLGVDDSAVMRQLLSALLTRESGVSVTTAADPLIAMRKMRTWRPQVVVLDLVMPRMDGMELLRRVVQEYPDIPVIILTARSRESDRVKGLKMGADDYVLKPFSVKELLARVEAVLRRDRILSRRLRKAVELHLDA